jgi:multicomponent Na+:H+ antiporter subunit B
LKDYILKRVVILLLPLMQVFGLYVIFHGHLSPGGGFAGGMIVGLGLVCYAAVYGMEKGTDKVPDRAATLIESFGTLWYGAVGLVGVFKGTLFLSNKATGVPMGQPAALLSGGWILVITLGVGIKVASTIVTLFYALTEEEES